MKDLELAPYYLFSLKAKWKKKYYRRIPFTYKDGRTYVDYPINTLDVHILVRNVDQHLKAFNNLKALEENPDIPKEFTLDSEETDSYREQSIAGVFESIQNSLRFYRCEINSQCGRMDKKYFSEKTSVFDGLLSIFKTPELFTIDSMTISCNLLESIVNVKLKGNTSYWTDLLFSESENAFHEVGFELGNKEIPLFRIVTFGNPVTSYRENMYTLILRSINRCCSESLNSTLETINSCFKTFHNSLGMFPLYDFPEIEPFSKPYSHLILLQAISKFISSSSGLRVALSHFPTVEQALTRIENLFPLILECKRLKNSIEDNELRNVLGKMKIPAYKGKNSCLGVIVEVKLCMNYFFEDKRLNRNAEMNKELFESRRNLINIFPEDLFHGMKRNQIGVLGICYCILAVVQKIEQYPFNSNHNPYETVLEIIEGAIKSKGAMWRFYHAFTKCKQAIHSKETKDSFFEKFTETILEFPWNLSSFQVNPKTIKIDFQTFSRYEQFISKCKCYFTKLEIDEFDKEFMGFLFVALTTVVLSLIHISNRKIVSPQVVYVICLAENLVSILDDLFERYLTTSQMLDIDLENNLPGMKDSYMNQILLDLLKAELSNENVNLFLYQLSQECIQFNNRKHFPVISNISALIESVRFNNFN